MIFINHYFAYRFIFKAIAESKLVQSIYAPLRHLAIVTGVNDHIRVIIQRAEAVISTALAKGIFYARKHIFQIQLHFLGASLLDWK